jgi:exosome complex protein LRP1
VKAKEHAIFVELTRVKQYFAKIKLAENGPEKREVVLNKAVAGRFLKHDFVSCISVSCFLGR